jgi:hypothetical protein
MRRIKELERLSDSTERENALAVRQQKNGGIRKGCRRFFCACRASRAERGGRVKQKP